MSDIDINWEFAEVYESFVNDFMECKHRRYSLYGGRNSAKSTAAYQLVVMLVMAQGNVICTRRYANTLGDSSYSHIKSLIDDSGLSDFFKFSKSPYRITCLLTGYTIYFKGLDNPEKVKSTKAPKGDVVMVLFEEAQEIPNGGVPDDIIFTFERGKGDANFRALFVFNPPPSKNHFTNRDYRKSSDDDTLLALYTSYKDLPAEWVGVNARKDIEALKQNNYKLYLYKFLGQPISAEDTVFENVRLEKISGQQIQTWINNDAYLFVGLDFGWSPDPNAACMMYFDVEERKLYIFKEFHANKLNNMQISEGLLNAGFSPDYRITCDNDEKTVNDLNSYGWTARAAKKGAGSVARGFKWLQGLQAIIIDDQRCPYTASEFIELHYDADRYGDLKNEYPDGQADHHIASVRYAMESIIRKAGV